MRYTVDDILAMGPCIDYNRERVTELFAGRETITPFDVAVMDIPKKDIGWAIGRMLPWPDGFVFPEGVTYLSVENNPALTELTVPEGVTYLSVENNPALTELTVPEGVTYLRVVNNGARLHSNDNEKLCDPAKARPRRAYASCPKTAQT